MNLAILQIKQIKNPVFKTTTDRSFLDHEMERLENFNAYVFLSI